MVSWRGSSGPRYKRAGYGMQTRTFRRRARGTKEGGRGDICTNTASDEEQKITDRSGSKAQM